MSTLVTTMPAPVGSMPRWAATSINETTPTVSAASIDSGAGH
jgi:hypothetical protein